MPIKDILLRLEANDSQPAIDFATSLATRTRAHLTAAGIAIEYPPPAVGPSLGGLGFGGIAMLEKFAQENRDAIEKFGQQFIANVSADLQTNFVLIQGYPGVARREFARLARYFDLSVIGQETSPEVPLDRSIAIETLFGSGRPVFVVPFIYKGPARFERAMVCWDGGVQAARALTAAMPLLALCQTVEVVTVAGDRAPRAEPNLNIAGHLERHCLRVSWTALPDAGEVGESLLSYAADTGADYIVMGAYGHWRLTEFVIGGTTRTILRSMTAPVLMAH